MIQAVSLSRLDKYSFFSAVPQSWSFFYSNHPRLCFCAETRMIFFMRLPGVRGPVGAGRQNIFSILGNFVLLLETRVTRADVTADKNVEIAWLLSTSLHKAFFYEKSSVVNHIQKSFRSISPFFSAKSCCHPFDYGQILKIAVLPVTNIESRGTVDKKRKKCVIFVYRTLRIWPVWPRK